MSNLSELERLKNLHRLESSHPLLPVVDVERCSDRARMLVMEWYFEVRLSLKLSTKTIELAIGYFERFLAKVPVSQQQLYNIAMSCMFLAIKFCEVTPIQLRDLYNCSHSETVLPNTQLFCRIEALILQVLEWKLTSPTVAEFIELYGELCSRKDKDLRQALSFVKVALSNRWTRSYRRSEIAVALLTIAGDMREAEKEQLAKQLHDNARWTEEQEAADVDSIAERLLIDIQAAVATERHDLDDGDSDGEDDTSDAEQRRSLKRRRLNDMALLTTSSPCSVPEDPE